MMIQKVSVPVANDDTANDDTVSISTSRSIIIGHFVLQSLTHISNGQPVCPIYIAGQALQWIEYTTPVLFVPGCCRNVWPLC